MRAILRLIRSVEEGLSGKLSRKPDNQQPMEIYPLIVDELESNIAPGPHGRIWPWSRVTVRVQAQNEKERGVWRQIFSSLDNDLKRRLHALECEAPAGLLVTCEIVDQLESGRPFEIDGQFVEDDVTAGTGLPCCLEYTGPDGPGRIELRKGKVWLGRQEEVHEKHSLKVIRNQIVLDHPTVGRSHACIELNDEGQWVVRHLSKSSSTRVMRDGTLHQVVLLQRFVLQDGDLLYLGKCVRTVRFSRLEQ
jgi:hypothetical protein